jgi:hypothetical protein
MTYKTLEAIEKQLNHVLNNSNNILYINRLYKLFILLFLELKRNRITNDIEINFLDNNNKLLNDSIFYHVKFKFKKKWFGFFYDEGNSHIEFILRDDKTIKYILYQNKFEAIKSF